jgi:hypothetical protein
MSKTKAVTASPKASRKRSLQVGSEHGVVSMNN